MTDTDARLLRLLTEGDLPRVWSLLVTIFGDLTLDRSDGLSGTVLHQMTDVIGLKPEAVRVGLHRLRKEGWIESQRLGRKSLHCLSISGRKESEAARAVIYGDAPRPDTCQLVLSYPDTAAPDGAAKVGPAMFLSCGPGNGDAYSLPLSYPLPGWMRDRVCDAAICDASAVCEAQFVALERALATNPVRSPLIRMVLRVLIVHNWRRVILKVPRLPDEVFPDDWRGGSCRGHVGRLLAALPRPEPEELLAA